MAHVIIGIHGLGNKPPCKLLEQWWKLAMIEGLRSICQNPPFPKFELVYWSDYLYDKPLDISVKDIYNPLYLEEKYTTAPDNFQADDHTFRKKVVDYLRQQLNRIFLNDDLSLNYSFISDAIISRYFKDLEIYYADKYPDDDSGTRNANELIRERLKRKLIEHRNDEIMLISHSMGSIIAFDVLASLPPEIKINTFITIGSPLGLPFIISKLSPIKNSKGISGKLAPTPAVITRNWYNFSDILDKIAFSYKLSDEFSENSLGIKPIDFLVVNNYELNGNHNPHKSFGYLRTPEFSQVLCDFILSEKITLRQNITRRLKGFINDLKTQISTYKKKMDPDK